MMTTLKSSLEDNSKATHMKNIPEDVIILILVTLPVKSLMRFRCVCKSWYDLIRSPKFIEMHSLYTKHKKNECILIPRINTYYETVLSFHSYDSPNLEIPPLNSESDDRRFDVSNPCNGLLLLVSYDTRTLILCNPATREFKLLPPHPIPFTCPDPDVEIDMRVYIFGLGFGSKKNEYKAFVQLHDNKYFMGRYASLVYNVSTNTWRQINTPEIDEKCFEDTQGIQYNGALHWVVGRNRIVERNDINYLIIICFDLSTEVFQEIRFPQAVPYKIDKNLTIVNDCLALFTYSYFNYDLESKYVDIWVMKEYGVVGSWTKQFSISGIQNTFISWYPRLLWRNEAILIEAKTKEENRKLLSFALDETHNMTDTRLMDDYQLREVMVYKESLVSIK